MYLHRRNIYSVMNYQCGLNCLVFTVEFERIKCHVVAETVSTVWSNLRL